MRIFAHVCIAALMAMTLSLTAVSRVYACSVVGDPPSPESLVMEADAIYLAQATRYVGLPSSQGLDVSTKAEFVVLETLKGPKLARLEIPAEFVDKDDFNDQNKIPRTWIRPDGRRGSCYATHYKQGGEYLLLIKRGTPYWRALMPTNDQITGPSDPWVLWVKQAVAKNAAGKP